MGIKSDLRKSPATTQRYDIPNPRRADKSSVEISSENMISVRKNNGTYT
jgi:hypothetical protein